MESDHKRRSENWELRMVLIDMKGKANESDAYRFRMLDNGMPAVVAVSRAAGQVAGGFSPLSPTPST